MIELQLSLVLHVASVNSAKLEDTISVKKWNFVQHLRTMAHYADIMSTQLISVTSKLYAKESV